MPRTARGRQGRRRRDASAASGTSHLFPALSLRDLLAARDAYHVHLLNQNNVVATVERVGSIACLVSDGQKVYALTNRHVTGEENQKVFSFMGGKKLTVGVSSKSRLDQRVAQPNRRTDDMWEALGKKTVTCMAGGCLRMASLWASAWREGGGNKIAASKLGEVGQDELMDLYNDKSFLPAFRLQDPGFAAALK